MVALVWHIFAAIDYESGAGWLMRLVVCFPIYGWILKQKKRTLWWLFILFVPFGWIVFLSLENRSEVIDMKDGKIITRPRDDND